MPVHVAGVIRDLLFEAEVPAKDARVLLMGGPTKRKLVTLERRLQNPWLRALGEGRARWGPPPDEPLLTVFRSQQSG